MRAPLKLVIWNLRDGGPRTSTRTVPDDVASGLPSGFSACPWSTAISPRGIESSGAFSKTPRPRGARRYRGVAEEAVLSRHGVLVSRRVLGAGPGETRRRDEIDARRIGERRVHERVVQGALWGPNTSWLAASEATEPPPGWRRRSSASPSCRRLSSNFPTLREEAEDRGARRVREPAQIRGAKELLVGEERLVSMADELHRQFPRSPLR